MEHTIDSTKPFLNLGNSLPHALHISGVGLDMEDLTAQRLYPGNNILLLCIQGAAANPGQSGLHSLGQITTHNPSDSAGSP